MKNALQRCLLVKNLGCRPAALENSDSFTKEILLPVLDFENELSMSLNNLIAALRQNKRNKTKGLKIGL